MAFSLTPFIQGISSISSAFASIEQGKSRRIVSESNKFIAELRARQAKTAGQRRVGRSSQAFRKLVGRQRAALAAQGISLTEGSAQDIIQETQDISELDALTIKNNAAREALGFRTQARQFGLRGRQEERAGQIGAAESLVTGGLKLFDDRIRRAS